MVSAGFLVLSSTPLYVSMGPFLKLTAWKKLVLSVCGNGVADR